MTYMMYDLVVDGLDGRRRGNREEPRELAPDSASVWRMRMLTRDRTAESVSRDQILRRERGRLAPFSCSADHERDW